MNSEPILNELFVHQTCHRIEHVTLLVNLPFDCLNVEKTTSNFQFKLNINDRDIKVTIIKH